MSPQDLYTIIGSNVVAVVAVGGLVGTFFWRTAARLDADRRAFQAAMDEFRREIQRLAERQSHLEGRLDS